MKRNNYIFITILICLGAIAIAYAFSKSMKKNMVAVNTPMVEINYSISKTWEMPTKLNEISGIDWIDENTLACIEDEDGIIFIYDLKKNSIINEIPFAEAGDYEGLVIHENNAYAMRSDGLLYEILNYNSESRSIQSYETGFTADNNMETLAWDANTNSLITSPKDEDSNSKSYKGVYQISLDSKKMLTEPILKIDMNHKDLKDFKGKKANKTFSPSDIAIHPKTKDIYILEGKDPKLLIYDSKGNLKQVHQFDKSDFTQPEGITFSPKGALYISNEASKSEKANIQLVELN